MDNSAVQLVGTPCGQHGPYTFYKAFKYIKNGLKRIVKLSEFFFVKLWSDSDLVCIGELQLLWVDKNSEQVLSSLRLYFLPENTPEGRMDHGEDEVLAISEKVVLRLEDLITWITVDAEWTWGRLAKWEADVKESKSSENEIGVNIPLSDGSLDFSDLEKEQTTTIDEISRSPSVVILSYPSYCRYRAMMKRLEGVEDEHLKSTIVTILGGFAAANKNTRVLFCRDTFDYPELEGHELLCNHLAPKLKGRPRGRRKKRSLSPGSESNESESSVSNVFNSTKTKIMTEGSPNGLRSDNCSPRRSTRSVVGNTESKEFLKKLNTFMKSNHTPIGRIPSLGYKELDLYSFFTKVDKLGGYDAVTQNRLWKSIFDDLSGNYISTSAATVIRRHYERFLLPYERYLKGEEYKPPTKIKRTKSNSGSGSDIDTSESTSGSGNSTPVPQLIATPIPSTSSAVDVKDGSSSEKTEKVKSEVKISSLRSVRVKPERLREQMSKEKAANPDTNYKITNESATEIKIESKTSPQRSASDDNNSTNSALSVELTSSGVSVNSQKSFVNDINDTPKEISVKIECPPITTEKVPFSTPISVTLQKSSVDNIITPAEEKENIATCNTNNNNITGAHNCKDIDIDLTEVPYKPKTPDTVHSETETPNNIVSNSTLNSSLLHSVKKRKLDILKEGGLEVTPVKPIVNVAEVTEVKENRPSVIHHPVGVPKAPVGHLSITLTPEKQVPSGIEVSQRSVVPFQSNDIQTLPSTSIMRSSYKAVNKHPAHSNNSFLYVNGQSPPKVVQSKSIYTYSEKTVYGNPKDYFTPPPRPPPQAPKFVDTTVPKQMGGEILDLTVRSPQKPIVEIMRVPSFPPRFPSGSRVASPKKMYKNSAALPVLDARVGSNLEITLVGPNSNSLSHSIPPMNKPTNNFTPNNASALHGHPPMLPPNPAHNYNVNHKMSQKRSFGGNFVTNRKEENGRLPYSISPSQQAYAPREHKHQNNTEYNYSNSFNHRNSIPKFENSRTPKPACQPSPNLKPYATAPATALPGYLPQLSLASKMMNSYVPPIDPIYYSALQSLYPHNPLSAIPPFFSMSPTDQLQFYTDLMARNSQMRFPYQYPQDGNSSVTTANTETNNYNK